MIDQKTPNLLLPLPHPNNELSDDVLRLRTALGQIDAAVAAINGLLFSPDVNLDTVAEIVTVLKAAQGDIGDVAALLATKADKSEVGAVSAALDGKQDTLQSGTTLKTVNGTSLLGSGNVTLDVAPTAIVMSLLFGG